MLCLSYIKSNPLAALKSYLQDVVLALEDQLRAGDGEDEVGQVGHFVAIDAVLAGDDGEAAEHFVEGVDFGRRSGDQRGAGIGDHFAAADAELARRVVCHLEPVVQVIKAKVLKNHRIRFLA